MIVLGSTYQPVMEALESKLEEGVTLRPIDKGRPLADQISDVEVLILGGQKVSADDIAVAHKLKLIQQHGRGVDSVDRDAAKAAGITIANVPGGNSIAVAEHVLALILYLAKQFAKMPHSINQRISGAPAGIEISGKTLAIIGLGSSGEELAKRAKALGMRILATKGHPGVRPSVEVDVLGGPGDMPEILSGADFVVVLATLTEKTIGLIGAAELGAMMPSAYLINAARGPLVDYAALLDALRKKKIAGAAFDVFWSEPAPPSDPMLALDNFFLSPHVAGFSDNSIEYITNIMAENFHRLASGQPLINIVDPPSR